MNLYKIFSAIALSLCLLLPSQAGNSHLTALLPLIPMFLGGKNIQLNEVDVDELTHKTPKDGSSTAGGAGGGPSSQSGGSSDPSGGGLGGAGGGGPSGPGGGGEDERREPDASMAAAASDDASLIGLRVLLRLRESADSAYFWIGGRITAYDAEARVHVVHMDDGTERRISNLASTDTREDLILLHPGQELSREMTLLGTRFAVSRPDPENETRLLWRFAYVLTYIPEVNGGMHLIQFDDGRTELIDNLSRAFRNRPGRQWYVGRGHNNPQERPPRNRQQQEIFAATYLHAAQRLQDEGLRRRAREEAAGRLTHAELANRFAKLLAALRRQFDPETPARGTYTIILESLRILIPNNTFWEQDAVVIQRALRHIDRAARDIPNSQRNIGPIPAGLRAEIQKMIRNTLYANLPEFWWAELRLADADHRERHGRTLPEPGTPPSIENLRGGLREFWNSAEHTALMTEHFELELGYLEQPLLDFDRISELECHQIDRARLLVLLHTFNILEGLVSSMELLVGRVPPEALTTSPAPTGLSGIPTRLNLIVHRLHALRDILNERVEITEELAPASAYYWSNIRFAFEFIEPLFDTVRRHPGVLTAEQTPAVVRWFEDEGEEASPTSGTTASERSGLWRMSESPRPLWHEEGAEGDVPEGGRGGAGGAEPAARDDSAEEESPSLLEMFADLQMAQPAAAESADRPARRAQKRKGNEASRAGRRRRISEPQAASTPTEEVVDAEGLDARAAMATAGGGGRPAGDESEEEKGM